MTSTRSVVLSRPVRTAIGTFGGSLKDIAATELGAAAIKAALERSGVKPDAVGTVVMGNVVQAGAKMNPARQAAVHAGLPVKVPAMTVNRVCGSGAQAIVSAAQEIALGAIEVAVAGGMENMDLAPYLLARGRWGYRMGDGQLYDSMLRDGLNDAFSDEPSGWHTEDLAREFQVSREAQDEWALRSQQAAPRADHDVGLVLVHGDQAVGAGDFPERLHHRHLEAVFRGSGQACRSGMPMRKASTSVSVSVRNCSPFREASSSARCNSRSRRCGRWPACRRHRCADGR